MIKKFKDEDVVSALSPFKEFVFLTSSIFSGSNFYKENVLNPINWTSGNISGSSYSIIYDRSATGTYKNKLLTIAYGYNTSSLMYSGSYSDYIGSNQTQKLNIYKLFANKLLGNPDRIFKINNQEKNELIFLSIYRNLYKDTISDDGQISLSLIRTGSLGGSSVVRSQITSQQSLTTNPGGRTIALSENLSGTHAGLCFLESGIFVIDPHNSIGTASSQGNYWSGTLGYEQLAKGVSGSNLNDLLFGIRQRIDSISFFNQTNIRTTFYKCSAGKEEYNYSTNPTFLNDNEKIITASGSGDNVVPSSYITTIGLYGENYELIAVGKVYKPVKKSFERQVDIMVRLDY